MTYDAFLHRAILFGGPRQQRIFQRYLGTHSLRLPIQSAMHCWGLTGNGDFILRNCALTLCGAALSASIRFCRGFDFGFVRIPGCRLKPR